MSCNSAPGRMRNPFGSGLAVVQDRGLEAEAERMGLHAAAHVVPSTAAVITAKKASSPLGITQRPAQSFAGTPRLQPRSVTIQPWMPVLDFLHHNRPLAGEDRIAYKRRVERVYRERNYLVTRQEIKDLRSRIWQNDVSWAPLDVNISHGESKHGNYSFTFGEDTAASAFTLDDWSKATQRPGGARLFDPSIIYADVYSAIRGWNCKKSILIDVAKKVMVTANGDALVGADTWTISPFFASANRRRVVQVAMTAVQVLTMRESELPTMPDSLVETAGEKRLAVTPWNTILLESRKKLREKLLARTPPPAKSEDITFVDEVAIAASVNAKLIEGGYLTVDEGQIKQNAKKTKIPKGGAKTFNFTVNHIRAIIFFDWLFVDDLLAGDLRKK